MYIQSTDQNFPKESIRPNGELVLTYLGGLPLFDQMGLNQSIQVKIATSGIYLTYPASSGLRRNNGTTIFIPLTSIQYINALHQPQLIEKQQNKSMAKRAMVGSMVGGRRGARIGAISALGTKTTTIQSSAYHFIVNLTMDGQNTEFSMFKETTNPNEIKQLDRFHDMALAGLLGSKLVRDGNFASLQAQPTPSPTPASEPTPTSQPSLDPYEEITKLKGLLDQGIITQEEFDLKKKQLLGL